MKFLKPAIFFICFFLVISTALAKDKKTWEDEGELSFVNTGGNTEVKTLSVKNTLKWRFTNKDTAVLKGSALYGESDGEKNAENYSAELRIDHNFTKKFYSFALGGWRQDKFSGIDRRLYGGLGSGYEILNTGKNLLLGELGVNYVDVNYTNNTSSDFAEGRVFLKYEFRFTEKSKFSQTGEFLYDFRDTEKYRINSETALISALNDYFSLKASYTVNYDHKPIPEDLKDTDTILAVALVLNI